MRSTLLVVLLLHSFALLHAQSAFGGLAVGAAYGIDRIDSASLNSFVESFNTYYAANIKAKYASFPEALPGPVIRVGYRGSGLAGSKLAMAFQYQTGKHHIPRSATLGTGLKNELDLDVVNRDVLIEVGVGGKRGFLNALMQGQFRNSTITYYTVYQDGSRSIGYEFDINGYYEVSTPEIMAGVSAGLQLGKRVIIPIQVAFPVWLPGGDFINMTDYDTSRYRSNDFPREFDFWVKDRLGVDEGNAITEGNFRGMRISIGVEILLTR
ncbi:MAG: hypothetical protein JNN12_15825 [Bacteroidetes Order II. Incertae sedis bacterium]|nr:hypothetical protein [Bacteroidetes Order II. bacterium]